MTSISGSSPKGSHAKTALANIKPWFGSIGLFSIAINLLMLTGAIYMLQLYDRVLVSKSVATLVALSLMALAAFSIQGVLNAIRSRMLVRLGARFDEELSPHVYDLVTRKSLTNAATGDEPYRDVDRVRTFLSGNGPTAFCDMPFMPIFLIGCFLIHPYLGTLALVGGILIVLMTLVSGLLSQRFAQSVGAVGSERHALTEASRRNAEAMVAMGFHQTMRQRWLAIKERHGQGLVRLGEWSGSTGAIVKTTRQVLQSAVLGLGAYLAIFGEVSPGALIAASIMTSRALAPIETAIAHWKSFVDARESMARLNEEFAAYEDADERTELPLPQNHLNVVNLVVTPPGSELPSVKGVSMQLEKGSAVAIIGPSGAGKSTLARAMVGVWNPQFGKLRLDGASIQHYPPSSLGKCVGYLPQDVELFDGTVAENIARFTTDASSESVVEAAVAAGAHDIIVKLPNGYETQIGASGQNLSAGQRQRVALARALYGDPFFVVLDEPNSNLDGEGEAALNRAISTVRQRGGIVVIITHRASILQEVDHIAIMKDGQFEKFGKNEDVMPNIVSGVDNPKVAPEKSVVQPKRPRRERAAAEKTTAKGQIVTAKQGSLAPNPAEKPADGGRNVAV